MAKNRQSDEAAGERDDGAGRPVEKKSKFKVKEVSVEELQDMEVPEEGPEEELQHIEVSNQDWCPVCGMPTQQGAIQIRFNIPIGQTTAVVGLPLAACVQCKNVYMPASIMESILHPTPKPELVVASPKIILPS